MAAEPQARARGSRAWKGSRWTPYLFVRAGAVYLLVFQGYPLLQELLAELHVDIAAVAGQSTTLVGLEQLQRPVGDPDFRKALVVTLIYTARLRRLRDRAGSRCRRCCSTRPFAAAASRVLLVTIPWAAPPVAVALIFIWIYNAQYGIFSHVLRFFGFEAGIANWLDSIARAARDADHHDLADLSRSRRSSFWPRCRACPQELREAAVIDGADRLSVFKAVVWPTIQPSVMLLALFITIWSLRRFDLIWLMTQGGPIGATNTLVIELYRRAFVYQRAWPGRRGRHGRRWRSPSSSRSSISATRRASSEGRGTADERRCPLAPRPAA